MILILIVVIFHNLFIMQVEKGRLMFLLRISMQISWNYDNFYVLLRLLACNTLSWDNIVHRNWSQNNLNILHQR